MPELMKGNLWHERCDAKDRKGNPIVTYPVYVEDKHDEIRCHVKVMHDSRGYPDGALFLSYAGKPLANMQRFAHSFVRLSELTGWSEFDMGFEVNRNFNDSYRWVRSTKGLPSDLEDATYRFLVFGIPEKKTGGMLQQLEARSYVCNIAGQHLVAPFEMPRCVIKASAEGVEEAFLDAVSRGLEGVMVKQVNAPYERKRTDGWLKLKPSETADGVIVELQEAHATVDDPENGVKAGDPLGRTGSVRIRLEDGSEACPHGIRHDLGVEMHTNPQAYIGEWCEFKYMQRDRQGGYRHCTFKRLREAKE